MRSITEVSLKLLVRSFRTLLTENEEQLKARWNGQSQAEWVEPALQRDVRPMQEGSARRTTREARIVARAGRPLQPRRLGIAPGTPGGTASFVGTSDSLCAET